ncbi:hypothetical protein BCT01_00850 [Vibrio tasmaniensis]|nr:hypothetical protein BCT01_00850 [Vibrio tasmaniensis]PMP09967.1 hypothetical protein BCS92_02240 [Vibrio tasmaniensis]
MIAGTLICGTLYYFDEIITIPWALWRYADSFIWSNLPLPDFITVPHANIIKSFDNLEELRLLEYGHVYQVEQSVMFVTTWLYLLISIPGIKRVVTKNRHADKFKERLNLDSLIEQQSVLWRYNRYLIKHNPIKESLDVNVSRFAARENVRSGLKRTKIIRPHRPTNTVIFDLPLATEIFSKQLRYPIKTVDDVLNLPFQFHFFICIFASRISELPDLISPERINDAKKRVKRIKLIKWVTPTILKKVYKNKFKALEHELISLAYHNYNATQKIKHSLGVNEDFRFQMLGDYSYFLNDEHDVTYIEDEIARVLPIVMENEIVLEYLSQHAFAETFLRRLLRESRSLGKLSSSQFGYLKIMDRQLWYAMNDEGLPGSTIETAGIKAHFEAEYTRKRRHVFPTVDQAFSNLENMNIPKDCDQFDTIVTLPDHPYSELFPYDPTVEYNEHKQKLDNDPEYRIQQTLIRQPKVKS